MPEIARDPEWLGLARAYSGARLPELPENSELEFTARPTEFRADSSFSEPDTNFPKPECAALAMILLRTQSKEMLGYFDKQSIHAVKFTV